MQSTKKKLNSKGFTLIELLIVIIIIGILAAIAFVAYTGSQNKARKADAQSTLAQARNKLGEYNADQGKYPATIGAFNTWVASAAGGNNTALSTKFVNPSYTYVGTPAGCDNGAGGDCTGYTAKALGTLFGGATPADDITVTN
jgi:prepilin-type N-terminal cleavage/methylation domain-containing protein